MSGKDQHVYRSCYRHYLEMLVEAASRSLEGDIYKIVMDYDEMNLMVQTKTSSEGDGDQRLSRVFGEIGMLVSWMGQGVIVSVFHGDRLYDLRDVPSARHIQVQSTRQPERTDNEEK